MSNPIVSFDEQAVKDELRELVRKTIEETINAMLAEDVVNAIMDAEADQLCTGGANNRNGYRVRNLVTCVG